MSKVSFRFYKDHEVRAIWDEENAKWWFSVQDVVGAINDQSDYKKNRNYWKYLKTKLRKEGNGRSTRIWLDLIFKKQLKMCVDWSKIDKKDYLDAMIASHMDSTRIRELLKQAMTDRIDDREIFMKGIDYSYYYEQSDLVSEEPNSFELDRTRGLSNEIQQEAGAEVVDEGKEGQA